MDDAWGDLDWISEEKYNMAKKKKAKKKNKKKKKAKKKR